MECLAERRRCPICCAGKCGQIRVTSTECVTMRPTFNLARTSIPPGTRVIARPQLVWWTESGRGGAEARIKNLLIKMRRRPGSDLANRKRPGKRPDGSADDLRHEAGQGMLMRSEIGTRDRAARRGRRWQSVVRGAIAVRVGPRRGEGGAVHHARPSGRRRAEARRRRSPDRRPELEADRRRRLRAGPSSMRPGDGARLRGGDRVVEGRRPGVGPGRAPLRPARVRRQPLGPRRAGADRTRRSGRTRRWRGGTSATPSSWRSGPSPPDSRADCRGNGPRTAPSTTRSTASSAATRPWASPARSRSFAALAARLSGESRPARASSRGERGPAGGAGEGAAPGSRPERP